jgi:hypothetical protein
VKSKQLSATNIQTSGFPEEKTFKTIHVNHGRIFPAQRL